MAVSWVPVFILYIWSSKNRPFSGNFTNISQILWTIFIASIFLRLLNASTLSLVYIHMRYWYKFDGNLKLFLWRVHYGIISARSPREASVDLFRWPRTLDMLSCNLTLFYSRYYQLLTCFYAIFNVIINFNICSVR